MGILEMLLEFYPNGITQPSGQGRDGYCGFYMRCPSGNTLTLTLLVGTAKKGPIRTEFDGNAAKGSPEFCRLEDQLAQLPEGEEDLILSVHVKNPQQEPEEPDTTIYLTSDLREEYTFRASKLLDI